MYRRVKEAVNKIIGAVSVFSITFILTCNAVYANTNTYAEAGARWILDGLFWVVMIMIIAGVAFAAVKRNLTGALTTGVVGAIVLVIINDPNILVTLGTTLKGILGI